MLQTIKKVGLRWLLRFCKLDMSLKDQRQALVDTFINAIYLYDDKVLITFNYKEGTQTVTFGEATEVASEGNGSDLDCFPAPQERQLLVAVFFCFMRQFPFSSTGSAAGHCGLFAQNRSNRSLHWTTTPCSRYTES